MPQKPPVRVDVEWALWGRSPETGRDGLLACSAGRLGVENFAEIIGRYDPGTPDALPQVTVAWAGAGDRSYLTLARQEWSAEEDRYGRRTATVRLFCVPYAALGGTPVSYEELHARFADRALPPDGSAPLSVELAGLRPKELGDRVTDQVRATAALLLTGRRVCVIPDAVLSLDTRLRFLDTVAALLPYGMRTSLSASTWTSGTADHRIRLSFSGAVRSGFHTVVLNGRTPPPFGEAASAYLDLLREASDLTPVIRALAGSTEPLTFRDGADEALLRLEHAVHGRPADVAAALTACADTIDRRRWGVLRERLPRLARQTRVRWDPEARERHREVVEARGLLSARSVPSDVRADLYDAVLLLAYGPALTHADVARILDSVGEPSADLVAAIVRHAVADLDTALLLGDRPGGGGGREIVRRADAADLVAWVAAHPDEHAPVDRVLAEILSRRRSDAGAVLAALRDHDYLADAVAVRHADDHRAQVRVLRDLLVAAYGGRYLTDEQRREVAEHPAAESHPALREAAEPPEDEPVRPAYGASAAVGVKPRLPFVLSDTALVLTVLAVFVLAVLGVVLLIWLLAS
ncbi:hypothetical protein [Actinomadura rayongensis]|uniref:Uncharacterized protein n=1 Tax=Actinomadura rayongensis TaxID=1429076 RepID=A0A6I4W569_9ACTN|nr:hypothetical protein [Actinomadura rayongensis]MXQ64443.1 hypothetical protein [Actinomadura rayongensis]